MALSRHILRVWLATGLIALVCAPANAQIPGFGRGKKDPEKEAEKAKKAEAKNVAKYERLKTFALNRYETDLDFRDDVDESFDDLLREHSQRAYDKNTGRNSYVRVVHEDSWRVHENLYDNLLVQDHINRIGQRLVPEDSELAFAFKVVPEPTPLAETLSTGTVYISTGLISLLDTEAQLAYVLAHEMAHVHLQHWKERVMMQEGAEAFEAERQKKVGRWMLLGTLGGAALGAGVGAAAGNTGKGLGIGLAAGVIGGVVAGNLLNRPLIVNWDRVQEDQADELAFKSVLKATYDIREVPTLYVSMEKATLRDARVGLGFLGNRSRIKQRREKAADLIGNAYKAEIEAQLQKGFIASSAEHRNLMAELKRDNGIMAYYRDMFELARTNLADATAIRDNDAAAHYFYGKVLKLVGRTADDQKLARDAFYKATQSDSRRQQFGAHLHLALMMAREQGVDRKQVASEIDNYVTDYARWHVENAAIRAFPPNLDSIYEYMLLYGDPGWRPKAPDLKDMPTYRTLYDALDRAQVAGVVREVNHTPASGSAIPAGGNQPPPPGVVPTNPVRGVIDAATGSAARKIGEVTTAPRAPKKK